MCTCSFYNTSLLFLLSHIYAVCKLALVCHHVEVLLSTQAVYLWKRAAWVIFTHIRDMASLSECDRKLLGYE